MEHRRAAGRPDVRVEGGETWSGSFLAMAGVTRGYYGELHSALHPNPAHGGLSWTGPEPNCYDANGWFVIDRARYRGDELVAVDLRFEQACAGAPVALHGKIHWRAT
jgi:hypothetical protein